MSEMCGGGGNAVGPPQLTQAEVWWWLNFTGGDWEGGSMGDRLSFFARSRDDVCMYSVFVCGEMFER